MKKKRAKKAAVPKLADRGKLKRTSVQLSTGLLERINAEAVANGESQSEVIRRAVDRYFVLSDMIRARLVDSKTAAEIEKA